ncbi:MAG TPA: MAPEG family protein [Rhizomicrobium sp.]|nr:MAPEG family protein [Rhizomicrobium sp.]
MNIFTGSIEIQMLCWAVVLGLVQLVIAATLATKDQGLPYNLSARDLPPPPVTPLTARFQRAFGNFRETFVYFAVAVLVVTALAKNSPMSALGAQIYFWSRLLYVPLYAAGIAGARTAVWAASIIGLVMVLLAAAA